MGFDTARYLRLVAASPVLARNIVQVVSLEGRHVRYLAEHVGREPFASTARPGDVRDASTTAVGIAALAGLDADAARTVVDELPEVDRVRTLMAVERARARGYALDAGAVHPSVFGVAVPVLDVPGLAVGVPLVEVLPAAWREDSRRYQEIIAALRAAVGLLPQSRSVTR
ncbi:hypothetical protein [Curtobacterium sp. VKM Ac-2887]|uniref:IclR family transcriptional regulator domain-containing protein n=1 Tax=Curtobacterium sp. VKM Ac-2887 TaxID=2783819 RepID=UPI00188B8AB0|nr:hypothetical protein [Curtobacterium sp. VKM Ac-2887]MBF4588270.1 hypothetical protein [Curtobacterium sp. VKM Ac-2887]